jgi:uncharacterized protein YjiS (DUF1127 family)
MHTEMYRSNDFRSGPRGLLRRLVGDAIARVAERRSIEQLRRLDDRLLRDVGLTRGDVAELTGERG